MQRPPDPNPGDPIRADHIRYLYWLGDQLKIEVIPPLIRTAEGAIALDVEPGFWVKITGAPSSGKHPWRDQQALTGGTWSNGTALGTTTADPAYEINGSTATLTNKIVRAWRDPSSNEVLFAFGVCS